MQFQYSFDEAYFKAYYKEAFKWAYLVAFLTLLLLWVGAFFSTLFPEYSVYLVPAAIFVGVWGGGYWASCRGAMRLQNDIVQRAPCRDVSVTLDEHAIKIDNGCCKAEHSWQCVKQLTVLKNYWTIQLFSMHTYVFPAEALTNDMQQLITEKLTANGAKK